MTSPLELNIPDSVFQWVGAAPKEPKFGLTGRDPDAPATVMFWAKTRRERLLAGADPTRPWSEQLTLDLAQCTAAEQVAWAMTAYQKGWKEPEGTSEIEKIERRSKTVQWNKVNNALAEIVSVLDWMVAEGHFTYRDAEAFDRDLNGIRRLSDAVKPTSAK